MKSKFLSLAVALLFAAGLLVLSPSTGAAPSEPGWQDQPPAASPAQRRRHRPRQRQRPKGVPACVDRLIELAANDPLIDYEGESQEIINNGLLWNDPNSHCSVGDDANLRRRIADIAAKWRAKDAAAVRSGLQELRGSV